MTLSRSAPIREQLLDEINQTPDQLLEQVLNFLLFLKSKSSYH
jgi:hypothetical protein